MGQSAAREQLSDHAQHIVHDRTVAVRVEHRGEHVQQVAAGAGGDLLNMLAPMLDANRDGSVVDDVLGMVGKLFTRR